jgi:hypothetical protein
LVIDMVSSIVGSIIGMDMYLFIFNPRKKMGVPPN